SNQPKAALLRWSKPSSFVPGIRQEGTIAWMHFSRLSAEETISAILRLRQFLIVCLSQRQLLTIKSIRCYYSCTVPENEEPITSASSISCPRRWLPNRGGQNFLAFSSPRSARRANDGWKSSGATDIPAPFQHQTPRWRQ